MQFQRGQSWSTSAPSRPPASTTLFYSTPLGSGFLPPEFARQGRVEPFPQAVNLAAQPIQQLPPRHGGQQQQWRPEDSAGSPPRSTALPLAPVPPPIPGFQQHQAIPGRFPGAAPLKVSTANSTPSTRLPGIAPPSPPPIRIPNRPAHAVPAPAR